MSAVGVFQITLYLVVLVGLAKPLGVLMARVYQGERTFMSPILASVEQGIYRTAGVNPASEMR